MQIGTFFVYLIDISTGTQSRIFGREIYLEVDLASLSTSWFSTALHFARNDDSLMRRLTRSTGTVPIRPRKSLKRQTPCPLRLAQRIRKLHSDAALKVLNDLENFDQCYFLNFS